MKAISTEVVISMDKDCPHIFAAHRVHIRVDDEGGGPYLCIRGVNDEANGSERADEFYLETEEQIDEFANICKRILLDESATE